MKKNYFKLSAEYLKQNIAPQGTVFLGKVLLLVSLAAIIVPNKLIAQTNAALSYNSQNVFQAGVAITPLVPVSTLKTTAGYSVAPISLGSGFNNPLGVASDAAGNVYVTDNENSSLKKIPADGSAPVIVGSGFNHPAGVALDAAGNIYVADYGNNAVKKIPVGGGDPITIGAGFRGPTGVAVDAKGNVYVADRGNYAIKVITVGGIIPGRIGSGFNYPAGVAVDAAGNVYVADYCNNAIKKILANGGSTITIGSGFNHPNDVAVDGSGNVYVADEGNHAVKEIIASGGKTVSLGYGFKNPFGIDVDSAGNVYTGDAGNNAVKKLKPFGGYVISPVLPNGLFFDDATGIISGTPTSDSPQATYTVINYNKTDSVSTTLNITVTAYSAPTVKYSSTDNVYTVGTAVTQLVPESSNGVFGYYITPQLPRGLNFDGSTGIISGIPIEVSAKKTYVVTANNIDTSGTTTINITVNQDSIKSPVDTAIVVKIPPPLNTVAPVDTTIVVKIPPVLNTEPPADTTTLVKIARPLYIAPLANTESSITAEPIVKQAVSPNGDGINDILTIENIESFPDNRLVLMNRSGAEIYRIAGYDNINKVFDGHSNLNKGMQQPGTYFYMLEYKVNGEVKRKTGFFILRY